MGMTYTVKVGHYIKLEDNSIIGELYEKFEDDFFYCEMSHPNIIMTNSIKGGTLFQGDGYSDHVEKEINDIDIAGSYTEFKYDMLEIRKFLLEKDIKHEILFGVLSYAY